MVQRTKTLTRAQRRQLISQRGPKQIVKRQPVVAQKQKIQATLRRKKGKPDVILSERGKFYKVGDKIFSSELNAFRYQDALDRGIKNPRVPFTNLKKTDFQFEDITKRAGVSIKRRKEGLTKEPKSIQLEARADTEGTTTFKIKEEGITRIITKKKKKKQVVIGKKTPLEKRKLKQGESAITKLIRKDISNQAFQQTQSIENRILTGQTVSPKELQLYKINIDKKVSENDRKQLANLKKVVISPFTYGRNLRIRFENGENNPLFNDVKNFAIGFKKGAIDPLIQIGELAFKTVKKASIKSVSASFDYGKRLAREAQAGNFVLDDDIRKVVGKITAGGKTAAQKTKKLAIFVKNNPREAALIAGAASVAAAAAGSTLAQAAGRSAKQSYLKNPAEFIGQVVGFLAQGAVGAKIVGTVAKLKLLSPNFVPTIKNIDIVQKGLTKAVSNNKKLLKAGVITKKQFDKNIKTIAKAKKEFTKIKKLVKQDRLISSQEFNPHVTVNKLIKEQGTKQTLFSVSRADIAELTKRVQLAEVSFRNATVPEKLRGLVRKFPTNVRNTIGAVIQRKNIKDSLVALRVKRLTKGKFDALSFKAVPGGERAKFLEDFMFFDKAGALSYGGAYKGGDGTTTIIRFLKANVSKFPKSLQGAMRKAGAGKLSQRQVDALRRKLVAHVKKNPNKVFVGTRGASGARANPVLVERELVTPGFQISEKGFKKGTQFYTKQNFRTKISEAFGFKVGNKFTYDSEAQKFLQIMDVSLNKPKTKSFFNQVKSVVKGYKWEVIKQNLRSQDLTRVRSLSKAIVIGQQKAKKKRTLLQYLRQLKKKAIAKEKALVKKLKQNGKKKKIKRIKKIKKKPVKKATPKRRKPASRVKRISPRVRKPVVRVRKPTPRVRKPTPRVRKPTPRVRKPTPRVRTPAPRVRTPAPRIKTPKKPAKPPVRIPRLTLNSKLPRGTKLKFDAFYKEKGRIKRLQLGLPLNKAQAKVGKLIDTTTARSMELRVAGITKAKDSAKSPLLKKFRVKRSKNNLVLKQVEKSKHSIDTRGEKKGLTLAKAIKKKKK